MDLFEQHRQVLNQREAPLASRLRPRTLDEFIGQDHIIAPGRLLRRAIQIDQLSSLIFYGPPGTGKTTLAQIIANTTQAHFITLNAVLAGVKEIRSAVESAQTRRGQYSQRTILFVDEVHRFNKTQQDALLPWVENGTIILIGATTENPFFEVSSALVSRSRTFQLQPLSLQDLQRVIRQALTDPERGYGQRDIQLDPVAKQHLINVANGDARALLNALELAVETTPPTPSGQIQITLAIAEESIQKRAVFYDSEGDAHFDTISAFIKSLRGSDADAALYWLARMIYAGEDPRFIFRRMLILASEDIGLADPQAIVIVNACAAAFDRMGLPEGHYPLAQATLYLATAPKSNSVMGFFDALSAVKQEQAESIPSHLKDGSRDKATFGHGENYQYPHAYREHWVAQQYLPSNLQGQIFYQPSDQGAEAAIRDRNSQLREAQWAALLESDRGTPTEFLSYSLMPKNQASWIARTNQQVGQYLAHIRDRIFQMAQLQRHAVVLDLNARSGLLTWEALRQAPEGGIYAWVQTQSEADTLQTQARIFSPIQRPILVQSSLANLGRTLANQEPGLQFDCIVGRNLMARALEQDLEQTTLIAQLASQLRPGGKLILAEMIPSQSQHIYQLLNAEQVGTGLYKRWQKAEHEIYHDPTNLHLNWDVQRLEQIFSSAGLQVSLELSEYQTEFYISTQVIERWFKLNAEPASYADQLLKQLSQNDVTKIQSKLTQFLLHQTVQWQSCLAYVVAVSFAVSSLES